MSIHAPYWPHIESVDEESGITAVDMLGIVFFLDRDACADPRHAVRAFEAYLHWIGMQYALAYLDEEGDRFAMPADPREVMDRRIVRPMRAGEPARMALVDPNKPPYWYYAHYFYGSMDKEDRSEDRRVPIFFRISQEVFARTGPQAVIAFALQLAEFLPYSSAYISPVITCEERSRNALPYVHRYPGFDVANSECVAIDIGDRPLGAYWVNLFGPRLSQALGGPKALRPALPHGVQIQSCGQGGFYVVLGDVPDVGDVNRQNNLPLYRQLAGVLRPHLQVPKVTYFTNDAGLLDMDAQVAWHERFLR